MSQDRSEVETSPHTLLVVDDNAENRDMLSRRLARRGFQVEVAEDGERALELIADGLQQGDGIDLVLLDIMMPGIDGLEVLRRLRADSATAELPVIMATARDGSEDVVEALDLGANDYITKPIDFAVVLARVKKELRTLDAVRRARASDAVAAMPTEAVGETPKPTAEAAPPRSASIIGPGTVLEGRYRLEERIGRGNFGTVFRARHTELDRDVAVKLLLARIGDEEEAVARFRIEGRAAVRVQHPNAVSVFDFGVSPDGVAYLVMELLEGEPLSKEIVQGRLLPARVNEIVQPVCAVLTEAHRGGLVHRDIKPENIFLQKTAGGEIVKVLDFGIAKLVGERVSQQNLTAEGFVLGTPAYMAPERLRNRPYDGRSDVYSLGIVLFQMLTGRLPFEPRKDDPMALLLMHVEKEPPKPRQLVPSLSPELEALVLRCLAKEGEERPTPAELADELGRLAPLEKVDVPAQSTGQGGEHPKAQLDENRPTTQLQPEGVVRDRESGGAGLLSRLMDFFKGS